ncbi:ATP-binding protein [Streptomyces filamentosus]|uniref:ATPase n=2 Tax=Streptomyces filamentosus TaxID=67294 RepID=A0A919BXU0_STRFL|nr:ATP-binding protein [Streptomyces filamentosus]GHG27363.1 ATPase [Streptomyces filamentosus]
MTGPPAVREDGMAQDDGGPAQIRRLLLHGSAGAVSRCRDFTARALADWGWTPAGDPLTRERADDVLLMVSEVVTNACLHGGGPEEFVLRHADGLLRVEVSDRNPEHPHRMAPRSPALPGGHGLMVLDRLASDWGSADRGPGVPGKVVWLEVSRPSPPPWSRPPADRP